MAFCGGDFEVLWYLTTHSLFSFEFHYFFSKVLFRFLLGSSVEVEASSSSRSTNIESPSSSIRQRKKQKTPPDMSLTSSVSLIDLDVDYEETQETTNVTAEETEEKQRTCMDSLREFGVTCKKYFEDIANSMIDYFNEISADYRAIAEQLEREWTVKFKEHIKIAQQRRESRDPREGTSSDAERIASADKVSFF